MSKEFHFNTFPSDKLEFLTMLYMQNQDLSDKTPEQLFDIWEETYTKISNKVTSDVDWSEYCF